MLDQLLSLLGSKPKATVGIAMSPSVGLEMIEINPKTKTIEKYGSRELDYDYTKREIADYSRFIDVLKELFEELKIAPKKCNVVLSIPAIHYGLLSLPSLLDDEAIDNAVLSDVEQSSYIFKRQDPVISWIDTTTEAGSGNKEILYSAIQESALNEITAACLEVGCTIVAVETAPNSLLKALSYNQLAEEQMLPDTEWNLMIISPNSYSILTLNGKTVVGHREEPIALRSFIGEEIYEAIISSAQMYLQTVSASYLYIISETDIVSSEVLSMKIPFDGNIKFLEANKYVQNPLMPAQATIPPEVLLKVTPEVIGAGIYKVSDYPMKLNLLGKDMITSTEGIEIAPVVKIGNMELELSTSFMQKFAIIAALIIIIPTAIALSVLKTLSTEQQSKLDEMNQRIEANKAELDNYAAIDKKGTFDVKLETNTIQAFNRAKLIYYSAIGANIPKDAWLVYLKIYSDKKVDIIGRSLTADSVYSFYRGMKMSVINSDLRLNRLEMATDDLGNIVIDDVNSIKPKFYEFEVTNFTEEELNQLDDEVNSGARGDSESKARRKRGFLYGDFLDIPESTGNASEQGDAGQNSGGEPPKNLPANLESIEKF